MLELLEFVASHSTTKFTITDAMRDEATKMEVRGGSAHRLTLESVQHTHVALLYSLRCVRADR